MNQSNTKTIAVIEGDLSIVDLPEKLLARITERSQQGIMKKD